MSDVSVDGEHLSPGESPSPSLPDIKMVPAHEQSITLHIVECYPSHEPRESDPHYHYFNEARARLKRLGKLKCWIGNEDCAGQIELHHSAVEFALANGVDLSKFEELYPEFKITCEEDFLRCIEGEGSLTPLCKIHHTGILGVHSLPYPNWLPQKFWKKGTVAPAHSVPAISVHFHT